MIAPTNRLVIMRTPGELRSKREIAGSQAYKEAEVIIHTTAKNAGAIID